MPRTNTNNNIATNPFGNYRLEQRVQIDDGRTGIIIALFHAVNNYPLVLIELDHWIVGKRDAWGSRTVSHLALHIDHIAAVLR